MTSRAHPGATVHFLYVLVEVSTPMCSIHLAWSSLVPTQSTQPTQAKYSSGLTEVFSNECINFKIRSTYFRHAINYENIKHAPVSSKWICLSQIPIRFTERLVSPRIPFILCRLRFLHWVRENNKTTLLDHINTLTDRFRYAEVYHVHGT